MEWMPGGVIVRSHLKPIGIAQSNRDASLPVFVSTGWTDGLASFGKCSSFDGIATYFVTQFVLVARV